MRKSSFFAFLFLLVVIIFCAFPSRNVFAINKQQQTACNPIDVVFLVDHTSIMQQVDPNDLRLQAVQWMIMLLGYDRMYICPDAIYRIGVISYGGQTNLSSNVIRDIPLTEITPRLGQGLDSWRSEWKSLADKVKEPASSKSRNLLEALQAADKMLGAVEDGRKQAIVIFNADWGSPCTSNDCLPYQSESSIKGSRNILSALANSRSLWFYAFPTNSSADFERYSADVWENLFDEVAPDTAKFIRVQDTSATYGIDLAKNLAQIFFSVNNRDGLLAESGCNFSVPHFLKTTGFLIYKADGEIQTAIEDSDPQTAVIVANSSLVGSMKIVDAPQNIPSGNVEPFVIHSPVPGDWAIRQCNGKMYVLRFHFFANRLTSIDAPRDLPQYSNPNLPDQLSDPSQSFNLKFKLTDDNGNAVFQHDGVEPVIDGYVEMPDGKEMQLKFVYEKNAGFYHSQEPLPTRYIGDYSWEINFKRNIQAESVTLRGDYAVKKVTPVKLVVDLPFSGSDTIHDPCLQPGCFLKLNVRSFQVSARFVDESDASKSVRFRELFPNTAQPIEATLTHVQSRQTQTALLHPSLTDDYTFTGMLGEKLALEGEYLVEASLRPEQIAEMNFLYRFFADASEDKVKITRKDTVQTSPITYLVIVIMTGSILLMLFLRGAWAFTNPVSGELAFSRCVPSSDGAGQYQGLATISLASWHKRDRVLSHSEITRKSRLLSHIRSIKAWKTKNNNRSGVRVIMYLEHQSLQDKKQVVTLYDGDIGQHKLPGGIYLSYISTSGSPEGVKPALETGYERDFVEGNEP